MLAQTETKSKASLGGRNGRTDKSEGPDPKYDKLKKDLSFALREISNLKNQLKPRRTSPGSAPSAAPRARKMIHQTQTSGAKGLANKLSVQGHQSRQLPHQVRHNGGSEYSQLVATVTRRRKRIIPIRMRGRHMLVLLLSLLAFYHLPRRRLHSWRWSPDLSGQGQGEL